MVSEGSSAPNSAPAAEDNSPPSQSGGQIRPDQQQLPSIPAFLEWEFTSYDNYLEQNAQDVISNPDPGPANPHPHMRPQNPAMAGPAQPSDPGPVGLAPYSTTDCRLVASYNPAGVNNSPAGLPDGEAGADDGSSLFVLDELRQSLPSAVTTPTVSSPTTLALTGPPASSPAPGGRRERRHVCDRCPKGPKGVRRFPSARDLRRHQNTVHRNEKTKKYICWCKHDGTASTSRKDNHLRHVRLCDLQPLDYSCYTCICGEWNFGKDIHQSHVLNCGRTRTRRRRSTGRHSTRRRSGGLRSGGRRSSGRRSSGRRSSGRPRAP